MNKLLWSLCFSFLLLSQGYAAKENFDRTKPHLKVQKKALAKMKEKIKKAKAKKKSSKAQDYNSSRSNRGISIDNTGSQGSKNRKFKVTVGDLPCSNTQKGKKSANKNVKKVTCKKTDRKK